MDPDLVDPAVEGPRPASWRFVNAYINRLLPVAHRDPVVANAFLEVHAMVAPPQHILRPRIAMRVFRAGRTSTAAAHAVREPQSASRCTAGSP